MTKHRWLWFIYVLSSLGFFLWSYALVDPNLVLSNWQPYWHTQQWLWEVLWKEKSLLVGIYLFILTIWFTTFALLLARLRHQSNIEPKKSWDYVKLSLLLVVGILVLSHNALSHDMFNYLFNAKMVLQYQANPHVSTALNFADDPWTRFMHNTHTPAPYGYGWTALSLVPALLGNGLFVPTWGLFKILNVVALVALFLLLRRLYTQLYGKPASFSQLAIVFLNPLLLVEILANGHNDLWMMVPALLTAHFLLKYRQSDHGTFLIAALASWLFSLSTKFATLALAPVWGAILFYGFMQKISTRFAGLYTVLERLLTFVNQQWPLLASILMFLPLFTSRAQLFHPWYLVWPLVWAPLIKQTWWHNLLLVFSFSSLLRYVPWLFAGEFSTEIIWQQKIITWGIPLLWLIMTSIYAIYRKKVASN